MSGVFEKKFIFCLPLAKAMLDISSDRGVRNMRNSVPPLVIPGDF
jgi:hypothetical protein